MHVQKTVQRQGVTLEHGSFLARETVHTCAAGCRHKNGTRVIRRATTLGACLPPKGTVGYDVLVFVGRARFVEHRQREEIRAALAARGVVLSTGEVSVLGRRFLGYLEALHAARAEALRAVLDADGGWPLHIDATGENGRGTMLVAYAGWRGWALGAWKIPTERTDAILPRLRSVVARFGPPCAIMRDLGRAMTEAAATLVKELGRPIPILSCHLHFACDVGKDLLGEPHDRLRALFRHFDVRKHLRALARDLGRKLGTGIEAAREGLQGWQDSAGERHVVPGGDAGLAVVRALVQWVLDFAADGTDKRFPFDRPYHDLYRRCRIACRAADAYLRTPPEDGAVCKALKRLRHAVRPVESEVPFQQTACRLEARAQVFDELRTALRPGVKPARRPKGQPSPVLGTQDLEQLRDIEAAVAVLTVSLRERRPERGPAKDMRQAIDLVLRHLDRHGPTLFGHAIRLPHGQVRLVERTNNELEGFHHAIKHGERRRSGRKVLTHDFESLPAAAALAANLNRPDYVEVLCGSLDNLPAAFAQMDAGDRRRPWADPAPSIDADLDSANIEAASLPLADRRLIRTDAMDRRVRSAASSRAPRPSVATGV